MSVIGVLYLYVFLKCIRYQVYTHVYSTKDITALRISKKLSVGPVGLEPTTCRLKADCSTDWAMHPFSWLYMFYSPSESNRYPINWEQSLSLSCLPIPPDELRAMGFEPISSAWKADNLALDLCPHYTHVSLTYFLFLESRDKPCNWNKDFPSQYTILSAVTTIICTLGKSLRILLKYLPDRPHGKHFLT